MNRTQYTLAAIALVITMTLALAFGSQGRKQPARTSDIGEPAMVTPEPTSRPLTLDLDLPAMDPDQAYWYHQAQIVSLKDGVSATDRTLWLALLWTETGYRPWECSELGACGLGQLYGSLRSPETDADPIRNLSVSLDEWLRLIRENHGDYGLALESYKGVTSTDQRWQAQTVFTYIRIGG